MLKNGEVLPFPGMKCTVEKTVGKGSNAIVYLCTYPDGLNRDILHRVLVKELFPYHPEALIYRGDDGRTLICEAMDYFNLQKLSFERGNEIHLRLLEKYPDKTGANINTFELNSTLYSVIGFDSGRSLDKINELKDLREISQFMRQLLDALFIFHESGYLHLDVSPDNILVTGRGEYSRVSLIDYNSVHHIDDIRDGSTLYCSIKEGYTAPETASGDLSSVCEATDIYSVCAVFYRLLTGKTLTLFQRISKSPPDVSLCPCLESMPDTVKKQVAFILKRGLAVLPSKRYKTCDDMKRDIDELISRIDGTGITHAALWESGKRNVLKMIKTNAAFSYLEDGDRLYPLRFESPLYGSLDTEKMIEACMEKGSFLMYGAGGMGKTTAFLHTVKKQSRNYSPNSPVIIYVPLYGAESDGNYIKNKILENLKFDASVHSMEDARDKLVREFCRSGKGEKPRYILLLDGLNEISGDSSPVIKEILALALLPSVRVIVSSRNKSEELPFSVLETALLNEEDIRKTLSEHSLIYPEKREMQELLKIPMMLSVFCKTAVINEKQLQCRNEDELMAAYLEALCDKEKRELSEEDGKRWMTDAAVKLVLPFISAEMHAKNRALSEEEVYKTVKKCYTLISGGRLPILFPGWTGHSKDIKGGSKNAEEWYGSTVNRILRYSMGLIVKDPSGAYKIMHQNLEEYLLSEYKDINRRVRKQNSVIAVSSAVLLTVAVFILVSVFSVDVYDEKLTDSYLEAIASSHVFTGRNISGMLDVSQAYSSDEDELHEKIQLLLRDMQQSEILFNSSGMGSRQNTGRIFNELIRTGDVIYTTKEAITEDDFSGLFELAEEIPAEYEEFVNILLFLEGDSVLYEKYGEEFITRLGERLEADASLADALFYTACVRHIESFRADKPEKYGYYWDTVGKYADIGRNDPEKPDRAATERLKSVRDEKTRELKSLEIFVIYERMNRD